MRKPNANAILLQLPADQQDQLVGWLLDENLSYEKASKRVYADFGVVASREAVRTFWNNVCAGRRLRRAADAANALDAAAGGLDVDWDSRSRALVKQKHFEILAAPHIDPKELLAYGELVAGIGRADLEKAKLDFARQKHAETNRVKEEALALSREKFEVDACEKFLKYLEDATARQIANSPVSHAEKIARLRQTFFADVDALEKSGEVLIPE